jgi:hypothetical protein
VPDLPQHRKRGIGVVAGTEILSKSEAITTAITALPNHGERTSWNDRLRPAFSSC